LSDVKTEQQNIRRSGRWSGIFSPLPAPFPLCNLPLHATPLFPETRSPLRFTRVLTRSVFRSAHAPLTCSDRRIRDPMRIWDPTLIHVHCVYSQVTFICLSPSWGQQCPYLLYQQSKINIEIPWQYTNAMR